MLLHCPECKGKLHEGQHQFADGLFIVKYCKNCGFREEITPPPQHDLQQIKRI